MQIEDMCGFLPMPRPSHSHNMLLCVCVLLVSYLPRWLPCSNYMLCIKHCVLVSYILP